MDKKSLDEIIRQLSKAGFECKPTEEKDQYCHIYEGDIKICILFENGGINTNANADVFHIVETTKEYLNQYEQGEELEAKGLKAGYRKLNEYNGFVLAMREIPSIKEYEFVTWQYSPDGQSVNLGRYMTDYTAAKEDFAIRAGLIDSNKLFTETQLKLIFSSLVNYVGLNENIDYRTEKSIGRILERINTIIPEIQHHEELEDQELVEEDGLEL
jgi:hypothetical protein